MHGVQVRSNAEVISILGLGTWRLKGRMDEAFAALAAQLEGAWRHHFNMELRLCPLPEVLVSAGLTMHWGAGLRCTLHALCCLIEVLCTE